MADVKFLLTGDTSLSVEFGNEISTEINAKIRAFNIALENSKIPGIVETVPPTALLWSTMIPALSAMSLW